MVITQTGKVGAKKDCLKVIVLRTGALGGDFLSDGEQPYIVVEDAPFRVVVFPLLGHEGVDAPVRFLGRDLDEKVELKLH